MSTGTIEKGSRVKVEFEGEVTLSNEYDMVVKMPDGKEHVIAAKSAAKVTVTEKPLPPQPPVGTIVTDKHGCCVYKNFYGNEWYRLQDNSVAQSAGKALTWREVVAKASEWGPLKYLVEAPGGDGATSLKKKKLETTDTRQSNPVTVEWDTYEWAEGRVRFRDFSGGEILRLNPEGARRVAKAILATVGN